MECPDIMEEYPNISKFLQLAKKLGLTKELEDEDEEEDESVAS